MKQISYNDALKRLAAYCSKGERCTQDLSKKLDVWEISAEDQKKIIAYLKEEKFLDEERFCKAFVRDKSRFNKWGQYKIRFELKKKNIPDSIIREAINEIDPKETQEQLSSLLRQKLKSTKGKNEFEIKQKLIKFAVGRGFSMDDANQIVSKLKT